MSKKVTYRPSGPLDGIMLRRDIRDAIKEHGQDLFELMGIRDLIYEVQAVEAYSITVYPYTRYVDIFYIPDCTVGFRDSTVKVVLQLDDVVHWFENRELLEFVRYGSRQSN